MKSTAPVSAVPSPVVRLRPSPRPHRTRCRHLRWPRDWHSTQNPTLLTRESRLSQHIPRAHPTYDCRSTREVSGAHCRLAPPDSVLARPTSISPPIRSLIRHPPRLPLLHQMATLDLSFPMPAIQTRRARHRRKAKSTSFVRVLPRVAWSPLRSFAGWLLRYLMAPLRPLRGIPPRTAKGLFRSRWVGLSPSASRGRSAKVRRPSICRAACHCL